jgi:hypothetical protein
MIASPWAALILWPGTRQVPEDPRRLERPSA